MVAANPFVIVAIYCMVGKGLVAATTTSGGNPIGLYDQRGMVAGYSRSGSASLRAPAHHFVSFRRSWWAAIASSLVPRYALCSLLAVFATSFAPYVYTLF